ncbi:MAG TPA: DUF3693 domain-containing protein [Xylella fastidiosa subsp. pauca]
MAAIKLAKADPELAILIRLETAKTEAEKKAWNTLYKRLTATAATLLLGAGITCPSPSQAQSISKNFNSEVHIMHIMSTWRRWVHALLDRLEKRLTNTLLVHA